MTASSTERKGNHRLRSWNGRFSALKATLTLAVIGLCLVNAQIGSSSSSYDPASDGYSMGNLTSYTGAGAWWDAGYTGAGIDVAVIDTGVSPVPALSTPGKVVYGPDLSLESQVPNLRNLDTFGHGTFMAGLIAGHDPSLGTPYSQAPASAYRGMAPDARIISLKVGTYDGGADVSQVIAAIDWVVQHAHDPGFNIRVLNLSYGTNSTQSYTVDPLAYAAEQAWKHGIVVVASAGNTGYQRHHNAVGLADPAYDPFVMGVGAVDTNGTGTIRDDSIGNFSAGAAEGHGAKSPDFVAPGAHLQGLRVPGSYIDVNNSGSALGDQYLRGSGTSEAAAITSGTVALILQKYPDLTPDQVKQFIEDNAQDVHEGDQHVAGAGEIDLNTLAAGTPPGITAQSPVPPAPALKGGKKASPPPPPPPPAKGPALRELHYADSTGTGSLEAARGEDHLSRNGTPLTGEFDIFGNPFDATALAAAEAKGNSWSGGSWNGNFWSGKSWSGNSWSGNSWSGDGWSSNAWG